jgi:hypothetical protein
MLRSSAGKWCIFLRGDGVQNHLNILLVIIEAPLDGITNVELAECEIQRIGIMAVLFCLLNIIFPELIWNYLI